MFSNEKLFETALNLQEPWYVKRIEFDPSAANCICTSTSAGAARSLARSAANRYKYTIPWSKPGGT